MCESMSAGGANSWLWFHYMLKFSNFITPVEDKRQQLAHSLSIFHVIQLAKQLAINVNRGLI